MIFTPTVKQSITEKARRLNFNWEFSFEKKKKRKKFICLSRIYIINKMICIMAKQNSNVILDLHFNEDISIIKKTGR